MSRQWSLNHDQLEQEQLGSIRALIEDATRDTVLWLQANPSAEELVHVLAIQDRLAALERIITHRMERRSLAKDVGDWSETVREVMSLLDKARGVRGNMVGKGLARLADHLPKELPSPKVRLVTQTSPPIRALRGLGIAPYRPNPPQVPPNPPAHFPLDLWPKTCVILGEAVEKFPDRKRQMPEMCKHYISEMTPLFYGAVEAGMIKAGDVLQEGLGGMQDLLRSLLECNDEGTHGGFGGLSNKAHQIYEGARNTQEWRKLAIAIADASQHTSNPQSVKQSAASPIGRNIEKLRIECGWSFDKLAKKTGIDKKLILKHVNDGAKPHPNTMKEYAQAFAKELNRQITANNLKE